MKIKTTLFFLWKTTVFCLIFLLRSTLEPYIYNYFHVQSYFCFYYEKSSELLLEITRAFLKKKSSDFFFLIKKTNRNQKIILEQNFQFSLYFYGLLQNLFFIKKYIIQLISQILSGNWLNLFFYLTKIISNLKYIARFSNIICTLLEKQNFLNVVQRFNFWGHLLYFGLRLCVSFFFSNRLKFLLCTIIPFWSILIETFFAGNVLTFFFGFFYKKVHLKIERKQIIKLLIVPKKQDLYRMLTQSIKILQYSFDKNFSFAFTSLFKNLTNYFYYNFFSLNIKILPIIQNQLTNVILIWIFSKYKHFTVRQKIRVFKVWFNTFYNFYKILKSN